MLQNPPSNAGILYRGTYFDSLDIYFNSGRTPEPTWRFLTLWKTVKNTSVINILIDG